LDRDLYRTLSEGVHGTGMVSQTHLPVDDRWAVIQYIKGFSPRFVRENPAEPMRLPPPPADLRAKRKQGAQFYTLTLAVSSVMALMGEGMVLSPKIFAMLGGTQSVRRT
jgi:hypothetical protein